MFTCSKNWRAPHSVTNIRLVIFLFSWGNSPRSVQWLDGGRRVRRQFTLGNEELHGQPTSNLSHCHFFFQSLRCGRRFRQALDPTDSANSDGYQYWHWSKRISSSSRYPVGLAIHYSYRNSLHMALSLGTRTRRWSLRKYKSRFCLMPHKILMPPFHRRGGHTRFDGLIVCGIINQCLLNDKFPLHIPNAAWMHIG